MPGPYAFGSQTTQPYGATSGAFGGFASPYDQFVAQQLKINPNYSGGPGVDPSTILGPGITTPKVPPAVTPATGFTTSPQPQAGSNPFGYIPGQLGLPNPGADLQAQIPGLQGLNQQASNTISSYLGGQIPTDVQKSIRDAAAQFGVSSGMPGSGLVGNRSLRDFGLTSLDLTNKGLAALNPFVSTVSQTQTLSPALQAQIAEQNAVNAAAPDPTQAASYAKQLYDKYLATLARTGNRQNLNPFRGNPGQFNPAGGTGQFSGNSNGLTNFLPHVSDNLSYTPGAFDFSNQFAGDNGYGGGSQTTDYGILPQSGQQPLQFDSFGVPQLDMGSGGYGTSYPNYVQDWNSIPPPGDTIDWFGG